MVHEVFVATTQLCSSPRKAIDGGYGCVPAQLDLQTQVDLTRGAVVRQPLGWILGIVFKDKIETKAER